MDRRVTAALVVAGTVGAMLAGASIELAMALLAIGAVAVQPAWRTVAVVPAAVLVHTVTAQIVAFIGTGGGTDGAPWWEAGPVPPGAALVLTVLVISATLERTRRTGPILALLVTTVGTTTVAATALPAGAVGLDVGTVVALLAVADRTAADGLRRPGDPGPLSRLLLVGLAFVPTAVAGLTGPHVTPAAGTVALTLTWTVLCGIGLSVVNHRESRLSRTNDDLAALTSLFIDSEDRGVLSVGSNGHVLAANDVAEEMLGAPGTSILGHSVDEFVAPHRRRAHTTHRRDFRSGRATRPMSSSGPVEAIALDGRHIVVRIALRRVSGQDDRMMAVVENLTARRAEAEELRTRLERQEALLGQLKRLEVLRTGILTATSHELRTPVTVLHGTTELLSTRMDDLDDETRQLLLDRQLAQCQRLVELLDDLVAIDPDTEITTHPRVLPINRSVASITERWARRNEGFPVTVLGHNVNGWIDQVSLERIVSTLLDNARTHGAPPVAIQVKGHEGGAIVTVSDSGDGIPAHLHEEIFQPFGRGASIDEANPGLGLGLPLARMLAEADGGTLQAVKVKQGSMLQLTVAKPPPEAATEIGIDGTFDALTPAALQP